MTLGPLNKEIKYLTKLMEQRMGRMLPHIDSKECLEKVAEFFRETRDSMQSFLDEITEKLNT